MTSSNNQGLLQKHDLGKSDPRAIRLTPGDVYNLRQKRISEWTNIEQIWAIKYGNIGLAVSNVISNGTINSLYRQNFRITGVRGANFGLVSSFVLAGVLPAVSSALGLYSYSMGRLLVSSSSTSEQECPICTEVRGMSMHLLVGSVTSTLLSWMANLYQATLYQSCRVPSTEQFFKNYENKAMRDFFWTEMRKVVKQSHKGLSSVLLVSYSLQLILCSGLFYFQRKQFYEHIEPVAFSLTEIKKLKKDIE